MRSGNFTDEFKRYAAAQITERGLSSCGGVAASGREPRLAPRVEGEVLEAIRKRWRSSGRVTSYEEGAGAHHRGARHLKKPSRACTRLCRIETKCAALDRGGQRPFACWWVRPR
jgi:hypothetical protein